MDLTTCSAISILKKRHTALGLLPRAGPTEKDDFMRFLARILLLAALLLIAWPVLSQELPHAEFARGLRAKQYPDLALDYLLKVKKDGGGDKDPTLLLE